MKVYEAYVEGDAGQRAFFPSKRAARRHAFGPEGIGDWDVVEHADACDLLEQQNAEIQSLRSQLLRAVWPIVQQLPMTHGRPDPSRYDQDNRDGHEWVCQYVPEVAEIHQMKPLGQRCPGGRRGRENTERDGE